ncbi:MAG: DNA translocase FtsK 4TM domain-containing protein [Oligoflexales bacterium]|nr:DNA translocase FtsK 4TM domain-containing protein [Oligoflexales bacterium]
MKNKEDGIKSSFFERLFLSHYKDLTAIFLSFLFIYNLISILSYSPYDSSYNVKGIPPTVIKNLGGFLGSFLSSFLVYHVGVGALIVPFCLFVFIFHLFFREFNKNTFFNIMIGSLLFYIFSSYVLLKIYPTHKMDIIPIPTSGTVGTFLGRGIDLYLGTMGSLTFIAACFFASMILLLQGGRTALSIESLEGELGFFASMISKFFKKKWWGAPWSGLVRWFRSWRLSKAKPIVLGPVSAGPQLVDDVKLDADSGGNNRWASETVRNEFLPLISVFRCSPGGSATLIDEKVDGFISQTIVQTFAEFGVSGEIVGSHRGPTLTVFEFQPAAGVKQSKIMQLSDDLALALHVGSIMMSPMTDKRAIGIQVPNKKREAVSLGDLFSSPVFTQASSPLTYAIGKSLSGEILCEDLLNMPHLLIAGTTGSGKSVGINALICSLLVKTSPKHLKLILIDPKILELSIYKGVPHLLRPVITDRDEATEALYWAVDEMDRRYKVMESEQVRNIQAYNQKKGDKLYLPYIVIVIDELADLILGASKEFESTVQKLAQKARACGIHLVLATQRPSVDVVTGVIKANFPTRISFQVASRHDSRTIFDQSGAEKLLGKGDLLYLKPGMQKIIRAQGAFVSEDEIHALVLKLQVGA